MDFKTHLKGPKRFHACSQLDFRRCLKREQDFSDTYAQDFLEQLYVASRDRHCTDCPHWMFCFQMDEVEWYQSPEGAPRVALSNQGSLHRAKNVRREKVILYASKNKKI